MTEGTSQFWMDNHLTSHVALCNPRPTAAPSAVSQGCVILCPWWRGLFSKLHGLHWDSLGRVCHKQNVPSQCHYSTVHRYAHRRNNRNQAGTCCMASCNGIYSHLSPCSIFKWEWIPKFQSAIFSNHNDLWALGYVFGGNCKIKDGNCVIWGRCQTMFQKLNSKNNR